MPRESLLNISRSYWNTSEYKVVVNKAEEQISKRVLEENKADQIFRKTNISFSHSPLIRTRAFWGSKKRLFFGKFGVLCFLLTSVLRFALLPYCRRYNQYNQPIYHHMYICVWYLETYSEPRQTSKMGVCKNK